MCAHIVILLIYIAIFLNFPPYYPCHKVKGLWLSEAVASALL